MINYHDYLKIVAHLSKEGRTTVAMGRWEVEVEKGRLSTKIFSSDGKLSPEVHECVSAAKLLRWPDRVQLHIENGNVYLLQEIYSLAQFETFTVYLSQFLSLAQEWQEIIQEYEGILT